MFGHVDTTEVLNKAKRIGGGVPGVSKVVDRIKLERGHSNAP